MGETGWAGPNPPTSKNEGWSWQVPGYWTNEGPTAKRKEEMIQEKLVPLT
jgi:hypothetical protein